MGGGSLRLKTPLSLCAGVSTRREPRLAAGQTFRAAPCRGSARVDTARRILCHGASARHRPSCGAWLGAVLGRAAALRRRRTPGQFSDFEGDYAVERLGFALATIPLKTAKPIAAPFANFAGLKRITSLEVAHRPQSRRSVRSFSFASSRVCHCMLRGASSPLHASALM